VVHHRYQYSAHDANLRCFEIAHPEVCRGFGVCIRNSLESLFLKEGMNGHFPRARIPAFAAITHVVLGACRGAKPLCVSYVPPKSGGSGG
jgi:hypothetical protein